MAEVLNFSPSSPRNHTCISYSHRRSSSLPVFSSLRFNSSLESDGIRNKLVLQLEETKEPRKGPVQERNLQNKLRFSKSPQKWWEKRYEPNMKEITSTQDLVDSLLNAGDSLVVLDFFSPSCGGCRSLHPKIIQLAENNKNVLFLQVNYEEHKPMCYTLNVHVLPFFRFYRGANGRLCSFSCTNATHWIKDEKYSVRVKDEEGCPSFALINKATGQAMKHSVGATHPVQLRHYNQNELDESVLWAESKDTGEGYRCIRMINNIRLNLDAFHGDKYSGGVHDGTILVLWEWLNGENQRWKIVRY